MGIPTVFSLECNIICSYIYQLMCNVMVPETRVHVNCPSPPLPVGAKVSGTGGREADGVGGCSHSQGLSYGAVGEDSFRTNSDHSRTLSPEILVHISTHRHKQETGRTRNKSLLFATNCNRERCCYSSSPTFVP